MSQYVNCHTLKIFPVKTDSTNVVVCIIKRRGVAFQSSLAHIINFNYGMIVEFMGGKYMKEIFIKALRA